MYRMQEISLEIKQQPNSNNRNKNNFNIIHIFYSFTFRFMEFLMWCDAIFFSKKSKREKLHNIIKENFLPTENVMLKIYISQMNHTFHN